MNGAGAEDDERVRVDNMWTAEELDALHDPILVPAKLLVPRQATADCLNESASFRSRRRFPVVSWLHPRTGCLLLRSAQPSTGLRQNRCPADETLLGMYCDCTLRICNSHSLGASVDGGARARRPAMRIVDARSEIAAHANRALGKGTENAKDLSLIHI